MKIKITEIEATTDDLKASNTASDGFLNILRRAFNPIYSNDGECEPEECTYEEEPDN